MNIASVELLAGFSLNDADNLRKAMGKKKPEIMQKFSAQFVDGRGRQRLRRGDRTKSGTTSSSSPATASTSRTPPPTR